MASASAVALAATRAAMISPCTPRLCTRASIRPARNCGKYRMPMTSASSPARLRRTIRRVRLEGPWRATKSRMRRTTPGRRGDASPGRSVSPGRWASAAAEAVCTVRSSTLVISLKARRPKAGLISRTLSQSPGAVIRGGSSFLEAIAHAVERLDHVEGVVNDLEFLAQALDVAVDRAVVDIDLVVVGGIHQGVATFHHARA